MKSLKVGELRRVTEPTGLICRSTSNHTAYLNEADLYVVVNLTPVSSNPNLTLDKIHTYHGSAYATVMTQNGVLCTLQYILRKSSTRVCT